MPSERRNLRSNKDSTPSTNGEKTRSDSTNSASNKDKPVPARTASSKGKGLPSKKGITNTSAKDVNGDKAKTNGTETIENGVNGSEDTEMVDEVADKPSIGHSKEGEDEMTVVVPPPKSSKLAAEPSRDDEGDIDMEDTLENKTDTAEAVEVNPKVKAISGMLIFVVGLQPMQL